MATALRMICELLAVIQDSLQEIPYSFQALFEGSPHFFVYVRSDSFYPSATSETTKRLLVTDSTIVIYAYRMLGFLMSSMLWRRVFRLVQVKKGRVSRSVVLTSVLDHQIVPLVSLGSKHVSYVMEIGTFAVALAKVVSHSLESSSHHLPVQREYCCSNFEEVCTF